MADVKMIATRESYGNTLKALAAEGHDDLVVPDTRLLTLRDDPRPEICTLRKVFAEVYAEREKLIKAL
jgi:hypothetical protein